MTDRPFHHGNLRRALIEAGLEILRENGLEDMSLRRVAARAGVSHAAPAHHFAGKQGLVAAIAAEGFRIFTRLMEEERYREGRDPNAQLRGICRGYLRFAAEQNPLFRLIFSTSIICDPDPELKDAAEASFAVLAAVCALFEPSAEGPGANEIMIWSLVHGYAGLSSFSHLNDPATGQKIAFEKILPPMVPKP